MVEIGENAVIRAVLSGGAAVCGIGISNLPLIDFLRSLGDGVRISARDKKSREELGDTARLIEERGVKLCLGEDYLDGLDESVIFRTPGIRPDIPEFIAAASRGAVITSEMELFLELTPATVIGITGSDGKTTTTTLTYKMLAAACEARGCAHGCTHQCAYESPRAYVGGNIGKPLLPLVREISERDFAVVELSSFQLQTMKISPKISAITNITPNHLDWHTGMDEYSAAKMNICSHLKAVRLTVNADNPITRQIGIESQLEVTFFSSVREGYGEIVPAGKKGAKAVFERGGMIVVSDGENETEILRVSDILIPGRHNVENYMAAIANVYQLVSADIITDIAKTFPGVEHRLEFVRELDGVKYYNGSMDSSPTRTAAALSALSVAPVVICGGYDKKLPFAPLAEALVKRASAVVLTGQTAEKIKAALDENSEFDPAGLPVIIKPEFEDAVSAARELAVPGGIVLLSPACASFGRFKNFAERGEYFKKIVRGFEPGKA